jgi:hypothetical protein
MQDRMPTPGREGYVHVITIDASSNLIALTPADQPIQLATAPIKANYLSAESANALFVDGFPAPKTEATITIDDCFKYVAGQLTKLRQTAAFVGQTILGANSPDVANETKNRWLLCNGAAFDKGKYPDLAAIYTSGKTPNMVAPDSNTKYYVCGSLTDVADS